MTDVPALDGVQPHRESPIPGPKPLPLIGNLADLFTTSAETSLEFTEAYHREYGPVFALALPGGKRMIFASSHAVVSEMCSSPVWAKSVHAALEEVRAFAGDGLFTAYNEEPNWAVAHRLLMPAFGAMAMKDYFPAMLDIAEQMLTRWERFGPAAPIDIPDDMTRLTLDTIALCAFDLRLNSFYSEDLHPFVGAMVRSLVEAGARSERLALVQPLLFKTNRQYREDIATMRSVTQEIVATRIAQPEHARPSDLLERMLTAVDPATGQRLPDENIQYQLATFLIAGHETTSGLLSFATHELLAHPEVLERARRTVDQALGGRTPAFEDLARLGYIGQILRETLRLHPTAPAFALAPSEDTTLGGYTVHQGESVLVMLPTLHGDPAVWQRPDAFDPDRFAPERMGEIPEYAWMPFGHGARACIGRPFALQEATLVLALMLQRFDFRLADPSYRLTVQETLTIKPKNLTVLAAPRRNPPVVPAAAPAPQPSVPMAATADTARHGTPLLVLYGSNGGSSERLARTIAADGALQGWTTTVAALDEYVGRLPTAGPVAVITSSYNGTPPDNAQAFVSWLTTAAPDLSGVDYFVLGCGSLDWAATYQRVPAVIDKAMAAAGARRIRDRGEADARTDFFGDWERWYEPLWPLLADEYHVEHTIPTGPRFRIVEDLGGQDDRPGETLVLENRELVHGPSHRSKRHLVLRLPDGVRYRTGDYLSVLPHNNPGLVARMIERLGTQPDRVCTIESSAPTGLIPLGRALRVEDLLTRYVDLAAPATSGAIKRLAASTPCPPERVELERLAGDEHAGQNSARSLTLLDLLEAFPSCRIDLALVLELLPSPRPRQYSISSAAEERNGRVELTVSVLESPARSGEGTFRGVASGYLQRVRPGDRISATVTSPPDTFRPPSDTRTPAVMIAAGTGIAPFRGFIRARMHAAASGREVGPTVLFFGCQHPDWDDLYADEFAEHTKAGRLVVHRAYSQLPDGEIRYVQHRLWQRREDVRALIDEGAHVYVCGDATGMGPDVEDALRRIGAPTSPVHDGAAWLEALHAAGRYATDVY
ncbi:bifunctional cytochrome P450/NADPH--P450 reductase [Kitasatospora cineracea]|uniref:Bifunctional cytochrome P450/NADPH--P450 reductase n=1 Tax=Kitasatospora cineracea TaxID=88074 RepID=A0A8G1UM22_9ACTN|nr:cytochrome P450 [Kitasatospora cineracea]ROR46541.1 cytochrome P450/NADPH-cytochrome P450 reductase [Kitasatospora cineracea]